MLCTVDQGGQERSEDTEHYRVMLLSGVRCRRSSRAVGYNYQCTVEIKARCQSVRNMMAKLNKGS